MAGSAFLSADVDTSDVLAGLDRLAGPIAYSLARSMGVAGGKVIRDEAIARCPVGVDKWYGQSKTPGLLRSALYLAYRENASTPERVVYGVTWNSRKAPHGHLVEFGHWQRFEVARDPQGDWYTTTIPLEHPRFVAATPFLRPALDAKGAVAVQAMLDRAKVRLPELLAADSELTRQGDTMSLEADIVALLGPLVGGRCYPDESPDGAALPFVVYQGVGGQVVEFMEQAIGSKENIRLQVVVWSRTRLEANAIIRQARAAIIGSTMQASTLGAATWLSNEPLKLRGARQDFSIWYTP